MSHSMPDHVTTNLRLSKERMQELRLRAFNQGESIAHLIREAIDAYLGYEKVKRSKKKDIKNDPFFSVIGRWEDDITDGAINHDHYIYGSPKKKQTK